MKKEKKNKKVLILGGAGYIGSRLWNYLKDQGGYTLASVDLEWFGKPESVYNQKKDIQQLTPGHIEDADVVVLLAGHSSVQMCNQNFYSAWSNNVTNFAWILHCMKNHQKLIYASSSSVYGHWPEPYATEAGGLALPVNTYDHTKQAIDQIFHTSSNHNIKMKNGIGELLQCERIFGLRFGTVCGYSENFRNDVMINAMWNSAKTRKEVKVYNGDTRRSILGIQDLCRAVQTLIDHGEKPKIYNLASFHSTSLDIGTKVAELCDVPCVQSEYTVMGGGNEKMTTKNYDFWVDTTQFEQDFNFTFDNTIDSIVEDINWGFANVKLKGTKQISKERSKFMAYSSNTVAYQDDPQAP